MLLRGRSATAFGRAVVIFKRLYSARLKPCPDEETEPPDPGVNAWAMEMGIDRNFKDVWPWQISTALP